ncbi:MAG: hypothetical protein ACK542_03355, partial [Burkholderiales bacterium]
KKKVTSATPLVDEHGFPESTMPGGYCSLSTGLKAKKQTPQTSFGKGCDRREGFCRGSQGYPVEVAERVLISLLNAQAQAPAPSCYAQSGHFYPVMLRIIATSRK